MNHTNTFLPIVVLVLFLLWQLYMRRRQWVKELAADLLNWRIDHGFSQQEAADEISRLLGRDKPITPRTWQRWESGKSAPWPILAYKLKTLTGDGPGDPKAYAFHIEDLHKPEVRELLRQADADHDARIERRRRQAQP